jgi:Ca2+-binding RTX toxin-like protein
MSKRPARRSQRFVRSEYCKVQLAAAVVETLERRCLLSVVSFASPATYSIGGQAFTSQTADLTGDGDDDLVTANYNGTVSVLLGNGDGTFKPAETFSDGLASKSGGQQSLAIADLGNGHPDILVSNQYYGVVSVLLGNGNGTFQPPTEVTVTTTTNVNNMLVGDLGNGEPDLVTLGSDGDVSILLGNGDGTFQPPQTISVGGTLRTLNFADISGDGHTDIVLADRSAGTVVLLPGNGDGTFGSPQTISAAGTDVYSVEVADLNGHPGLVTSNKDGAVDVVLGNGDGTFQPAVQVFSTGATTNQGGGFLEGDLNGDGSPDLIVANSSHQIYSLINNGDGTFQSPTAVSSNNTSTYYHDASLVDLNGDGKADLLFASKTSARVGVRLNTTGPATATITQNSSGTVVGAGTNSADTGSITYSGGNVILTIDGVTKSFAMTSVTGVNVNLGGGADSLTVAADVPMAVTVAGGAGADTVTANNSADDMLMGGKGKDYIVGGGAQETLAGGKGNDIIASGTGGDSIAGGAGDNFFINGNGSGDVINGGAGLNFAQNNSSDKLTNITEIFDPPAPSDSPGVVAPSLLPLDNSTVTASVNDGVLDVAGTPNNDKIVVILSGSNLEVKDDGSPVGSFAESGVTAIQIQGEAGDDTLKINASVTLPATLKGGAGNDILVGGGGSNVLIGAGGNDVLQGGAGVNLLVPGKFDVFSATTGNDTLIGGTGLSIADFSHRTDPLFLSNDGQPDSGDTAAGEAVEIMSNVSAIFGGTASDTIVGTTAGEFISGGAGDNTIHGGGATDVLIGGAGQDTVVAAAEPVSLYLNLTQPGEYGGISNPSEDVLQVSQSLDMLLPS